MNTLICSVEQRTRGWMSLLLLGALLVMPSHADEVAGTEAMKKKPQHIKVITLDEYLDLLKDRNPTFASDALDAAIEVATQFALEGDKDFVLGIQSEFQFSESAENPPAATALSLSFTAQTNTWQNVIQLQKKFWETGGTLTLEASHSWTQTQTSANGSIIGSNDFIYSSSDSVKLQYRQPLLENFGGVVDRKDFELQAYNIRATLLSSAENSESFMLSVAQSFVDWVESFETEAFAVERLELAEKQLEESRDRLKAHVATKVDVIRAEDTVNQNEQSVIQARATRMGLAAQLAALAGDLSIMMKRPKMDFYKTNHKIDVDKAVKWLMVSSREVNQLNEFRMLKEHEASVLRHQKDLPTMDLVMSGAMRKSSAELKDLQSIDKPEATIGVEFQYPIGGRSERGQLAAAEKESLQFSHQMVAKQMELEATLRRTVIELDGLRDVLAINKEQIVSARERTEEEEKAYLEGRGELNFVIQAQDNEQSAKNSYASNASTYQKSYLELEALLDRLYDTPPLEEFDDSKK